MSYELALNCFLLGIGTLLVGHRFYKFYIDELTVDKCSWCNQSGHKMRNKKGDCLLFIADRKRCSNDSYYGDIREYDENNFSAAGFLIYTYIKEKIYVLCLVEQRGNKRAYNFPGGKRDERWETFYMTAERELFEETNIDLTESLSTNPPIWNKVVWYSPGKYILIPCLINDLDITINDTQNVEWVSLNQLNEHNMHSFAYTMLTATPLLSMISQSSD